MGFVDKNNSKIKRFIYTLVSITQYIVSKLYNHPKNLLQQKSKVIHGILLEKNAYQAFKIWLGNIFLYGFLIWVAGLTFLYIPVWKIPSIGILLWLVLHVWGEVKKR